MVKSIKVAPGCVIYKRTNSDYWQARIKLKGGGWYRKSTSKLEQAEAEEVALELRMGVKVAAKNNLPLQTRRFSQIAKIVLNELELIKGTDSWRTIYEDYIYVFNKHLIPFFGRYKVDNLKKPYAGYIAYLTKKFGHLPSQSTLSTHFAALNIVFTKALDYGYVVEFQLPKLETKKGKKAEKRPAIDADEYLDLVKKLYNWSRKKQRIKRSTEIRQLLYNYVLVLANTGIRPGTEMMKIKWRHVFWRTSQHTGDTYLRINVWTEKGRNATKNQRQVVARRAVENALQRIQKQHPVLSQMTFDELLSKKLDEYVFALPDGSQPSRIDAVFKRFMIEHDLLVGSEEGNRTLYSFRHYYATKELTRKNGVNIDALARQMGTSIGMIQQYYSHLNLDDVADRLAGERFEFEADKLAD